MYVRTPNYSVNNNTIFIHLPLYAQQQNMKIIYNCYKRKILKNRFLKSPLKI